MKNSQEEIENLIETKNTNEIPYLEENPNHINQLKINNTKNQILDHNNLDVANEIKEIPSFNDKYFVNNQKTAYIQQIKDFEKLAEEELNKPKIHQYYPIFHFFSFLISILILYFCLLFQTDFSNSDFTYFLNIAENWKLSPLYDIYTGTGNCEKSDDNILTDSWPGLQQGCECDGIIYKGECPKNKSNCFPLKNYESKKFTFWQTINLCAIKKKINNNNININNEGVKETIMSLEVNKNKSKKIYTNYFDLVISPKNNNSNDNCPINFKSCGIIDSFNNYMCIPIGESCPINNINVNNLLLNKSFNSNGALNPTKIDTNDLSENKIIEKSLKLNNSLFVFSNKYDPNKSIIPVEFITSFEQPCKNPYYKFLNFKVFYLDPYYGRQKCFEFADEINPKMNTFTFNKLYTKITNYNNDYTLIDRYSYRDLLIDNKIYQQFDRIPVSFNNQLNQNIGLYTRNYFGINTKCHKDIIDNKLVENIFSSFDNLKTINNINPNLIVIILLSAINLALIVFFFVSSLKLSTYSLEEVNRTNHLLANLFFGFLFFIILTLIAKFIFSVVSSAKLFSVNNLDIIFSNKECVDEFSFYIYLKYFSIINKGKILLILIACFSFILLALHIVYISSFIKSHVLENKHLNNRHHQDLNKLDSKSYINLAN